MLLVKKGSSIERYLQEGLLAVLPAYDGDAKATIYTGSESYREARSVPWLLNVIATYYSLDIIKLRRRCGALLNLKHHISIPINENLILLPVKVRQADYPGETTIGYVSMLQVEAILPPAADEDAIYPSQIRFKSGLEIGVLNTAETLLVRMNQGEKVRADFMKWRISQDSAFNGLNREGLLALLPNCNCLLRELFMERFGLE